MTAPDKIWATVGYIGKRDTRVRGEFDTEPSEKAIPYVPLALAQAAVAAAYEAAAQVAASHAKYTRVAIIEATAKAIVENLVSVTQTKTANAIEDAIRALATPDQIAALAASPGTIPLTRAEVEALMEAARDAASELASIRHHIAAAIVKKALATLQERMK